MPRPRTRLVGQHSSEQEDGAGLRARFDEIRVALDVPPSFPPEVLAEAERAVKEIDPETGGGTDLTDLPFVTVDPPGSTDLDQAMHLTRRGDGYAVDYAIADVPAFVALGTPLDDEARRRGQTLYAPDGRTPLHPPVLSEGAASLLPDQDRPAFVWRFELDGEGSVTALDLVRATVRSRRQLTYAEVPSVPGLAPLLQEIGERRQALELARGGASLPLPEQEVVPDGDGYALSLRAPLPSEDWNAQLSLMTGMAAADLMLSAGVGVLRTLPAPEPGALQHFRELSAKAGVPWPDGATYGVFLRGLDPARPEHLALLHAAGALFRGSGYTPFDGAAPEQPGHAAVAAPYAHVTAPLRRLVDRFGLLCAWAAHRGEPVPDAVRAALPELPALMTASDRRAGELERRCLDAVEVAVLAGREDAVFDAVVVGADEKGGRVQLLDPPVLARCDGELAAGERVRVRVAGTLDASAEAVRLTLVR